MEDLLQSLVIQWSSEAYRHFILCFKTLFWLPQGNKKKGVINLIRKRMKRWIDGDYSGLWRELLARVAREANKRRRTVPSSNYKRAVSFVRNGDLSGALNALTSKGVAPIDADRKATILELHPRAENPSLPDPAPKPTAAKQASEEMVRKIILDMKVTKAGGPDGDKPAYWVALMKLVNHQAILTDLTTIINRIMRGDVPDRQAVFASRLTLIYKDTAKQKVRPIAVGCMLRKIAAIATTSLAKQPFKEAVGPHHVGLGVKRGN